MKEILFNRTYKVPLRTQKHKDGTLWFCAKDVCDMLGLTNPTEEMKTLDEDEKGLSTTETLGGKQQMNFVNESGLYHLIFQSRKKEAKEFRRWVTGEVLPSLRRNGSYGLPKKSDNGIITIDGEDYIEPSLIIPIKAKRTVVNVWIYRGRKGIFFNNIPNPYYNGRNSKRLIKVDTIDRCRCTISEEINKELKQLN